MAEKESLLGKLSKLLGKLEKHPEWGLDLGIFLGAVFLFIYGWVRPPRWESITIALLIAGAALAIGVLIGFLFGIPRTLQSQAAQQGPRGQSLGVNTNLEQISDWLTKIIVGVGLVQLTKLPGKFQQFADYLSTAFGTSGVPSAIVTSIILYFGILGFLLGYIWARVYLMGEFWRAEREIEEKPEFYEGLIHAYLYQPRPTGYENAIEKVKEYNDKFNQNARVWSYLAFAYGQNYAFLQRTEPSKKKERDDAKDNALGALRNALELDPSMRDFLKEYYDPKLAKPSENDLVVFFPDPAFDELFKDKVSNQTKD